MNLIEYLETEWLTFQFDYMIFLVPLCGTSMYFLVSLRSLRSQGQQGWSHGLHMYYFGKTLTEGIGVNEVKCRTLTLCLRGRFGKGLETNCFSTYRILLHNSVISNFIKQYIIVIYWFVHDFRRRVRILLIFNIEKFFV